MTTVIFNKESITKLYDIIETQDITEGDYLKHNDAIKALYHIIDNNINIYEEENTEDNIIDTPRININNNRYYKNIINRIYIMYQSVFLISITSSCLSIINMYYNYK